jgi:hypothetical protein
MHPPPTPFVRKQHCSAKMSSQSFTASSRSNTDIHVHHDNVMVHTYASTQVSVTSDSKAAKLQRPSPRAGYIRYIAECIYRELILKKSQWESDLWLYAEVESLLTTPLQLSNCIGYGELKDKVHDSNVRIMSLGNTGTPKEDTLNLAGRNESGQATILWNFPRGQRSWAGQT